MALYAQFYANHTTWTPGEGRGGEPGKVVSGMGDRAVIQMDARTRPETHHEVARDWIRRHEATQRFVAYSLFTGSIRDPEYTTAVLRPDGTEIPWSDVLDYEDPVEAAERSAEAMRDAQAAHAAASARIGSVADADGNPLVLGSKVSWRGEPKGTVESFDTRGQDPFKPIDVARVTVWVRDAEERKFAFRGDDLQVASAGVGEETAVMIAAGRSRPGASARSLPGAAKRKPATP